MKRILFTSKTTFIFFLLVVMSLLTAISSCSKDDAPAFMNYDDCPETVDYITVAVSENDWTFVVPQDDRVIWRAEDPDMSILSMAFFDDCGTVIHFNDDYLSAGQVPLLDGTFQLLSCDKLNLKFDNDIRAEMELKLNLMEGGRLETSVGNFIKEKL